MLTIFLDANVLVAASGNKVGGSSYILEIAQRSNLFLITSKFAILEAQKNIQTKLTSLANQRFLNILSSNLISLASQPSSRTLNRITKYINPKDAPILAATIESEADYLLTFDRKHFFIPSVRLLAGKYDLVVCTPGEFLRKENLIS